MIRRRIIEKLNSNRGVSMIFALLAFMVCVLVSVLIVSSALTSIKRTNDDKKVQQRRLTLNSAAEMIRSEFGSSTYTVTEVGEVSGTTQTSTFSYANSGTFGECIAEAIASIENTNTDYTKDITITVKESDKDIMTPVNCHLVFKRTGTGEYKMIATFSIEDTDDVVYLTFTSKKTVEGPTSKQTSKGNKKITVITTKTTYGWNRGIIDMKGDK